jgi:HSP20 family molecular chaperone IbpA
MKTKSVVVLLGLTLGISAFALNNVNPAKDLDVMRNHHQQSLDMAKSNLDKNLDADYQKFFKDMIANEEKDLKRMDELRGRLFPGVEKFNMMPEISVREVKNGYEVKAIVPDIDREDVRVSVQNNDLFISGFKRDEVKHDQKGVKSAEMTVSSFQRSIHFDQKVNPDSMKVNFKDGAINIHVDKKTI